LALEHDVCRGRRPPTLSIAAQRCWRAYAIVRLRFKGAERRSAYSFSFAYLVPPSILFMSLGIGLIQAMACSTRRCRSFLVLSDPADFRSRPWLLMGYFKTIPYELEELRAAWIDRARRAGRSLTKIVVPLAVPGSDTRPFIFSFTLVLE